MNEKKSEKLVEVSSGQGLIICKGLWVLQNVELLDSLLSTITSLPANVTINGQEITKLDSAAALLIQKWIAELRQEGKTVSLVNFSKEQMVLLELVEKEVPQIIKPLSAPSQHDWLWVVGEQTTEKVKDAIAFLNFIGETSVSLVRAIVNPRLFQFPSIVSTVETAGFAALPIVGLLSFLIGVVLAYQMGLQLQVYGANIFIVNASGSAILREFAPLITAIIASGRTSSSFTAEIGLMKVNEEIDALKTMGINPIQRLVLPRIIGLTVALPLLVFWANILGIMGSMLMANTILEIGYIDFLRRFQEVITMNDYLIGLGKAPVFALIIGSVGCYRGLCVEGSAESVGKQTTLSVVQAIFLIIVVDAGFSVLFNWAGI